MQLVEFPLGPLETNSFLLHAGNEAVMIDAGGDPSAVLDYLADNRLKLTHILITHLHFDHVLGVAALQKATGAKAYCSERDFPLLEGQLNSVGMGFPPVDKFESENLDESVLDILGTQCRVLATPGHSPGSLSYYFENIDSIFGGDVLFYRSVGRTDFPGGNTATLMESIKTKIYSLPDHTKVYPGHGPDTTVELEKKSNPFVR